MENNQILDMIRSRKSVREFTDQAIEDTTINNILEAGRQAPSGLNNQPWCFIIVRDKITLNSIAKCTKYSSIIHGAPLLIVVMLDKNVMYDQTKDTQAGC
jgi:nitroreductase